MNTFNLIHFVTSFEDAKCIIKNRTIHTINEKTLRNYGRGNTFDFSIDIDFPGVYMYLIDDINGYISRKNNIFFVFSPGLLMRRDYHVNNYEIQGHIMKSYYKNTNEVIKTFFPDQLNEMIKDFRKNEHGDYETVFHSKVELDTLQYVVINNKEYEDFFKEHNVKVYFAKDEFDMKCIKFIIPKNLGFKNFIKYSPYEYISQLDYIRDKYRNSNEKKELRKMIEFYKKKYNLDKKITTLDQLDEALNKSFEDDMMKIFADNYMEGDLNKLKQLKDAD